MIADGDCTETLLATPVEIAPYSIADTPVRAGHGLSLKEVNRLKSLFDNRFKFYHEKANNGEWK